MQAMEPKGLDDLCTALRARGYTVVGPVVRDGAIVYDEIAAAADLPRGWTDRQESGTYRLDRTADGAFFDFAVGPSSWKRFLLPPAVRLFRAERADGRLHIVPDPPPDVRYAFLGVRPCELAALAVQDRVLLGGAFRDPLYQRRRQDLCIVAVQCGRAGGTCFCASMGTGPRAETGFDLALTEVLVDGRHSFTVETGSPLGAELLAALPVRPATAEEEAAAAEAPARAAAQMGRTMDTQGLPELMQRNLGSRHWDQVAERCLACANCTLVCPTCFCATVDDTTDLAGVAERWRRWDSCFGLDFSYLHGGSVRASVASRYRQWITHKLSSWIDQFGTSGCVGCGRCITWCPVGIDLTAEVRALRAQDSAAPPAPGGEPS